MTEQEFERRMEEIKTYLQNLREDIKVLQELCDTLEQQVAEIKSPDDTEKMQKFGETATEFESKLLVVELS